MTHLFRAEEFYQSRQESAREVQSRPESGTAAAEAVLNVQLSSWWINKCRCAESELWSEEGQFLVFPGTSAVPPPSPDSFESRTGLSRVARDREEIVRPLRANCRLVDASIAVQARIRVRRRWQTSFPHLHRSRSKERALPPGLWSPSLLLPRRDLGCSVR